MGAEMTPGWAEPVPPGKPPIPSWAYLFAGACGIIPILTLGGAIPAVIGFGGASSCIAVARNRDMDPGLRVGLCAGITLGCWAIMLVIFGAIMGLFS
jgi:hypothetical protein